jgi:hypothetical protein
MPLATFWPAHDPRLSAFAAPRPQQLESNCLAARPTGFPVRLFRWIGSLRHGAGVGLGHRLSALPIRLNSASKLRILEYKEVLGIVVLRRGGEVEAAGDEVMTLVAIPEAQLYEDPLPTSRHRPVGGMEIVISGLRCQRWLELTKARHDFSCFAEPT